MKKHLFITGPVQTGKSTLLMEAIAPYREYVGGFISQRLKDESGTTRAFRLADLSEGPSLTAPFDPELPDIFLTLGEDRHSDISVFETKGIDIILKTKEQSRILLLDEIGGIELRSEIFTEVLFDALATTSCIGVLKGDASAGNIAGGIPEERARLLDYMKICDMINIGRALQGTTEYIARIQKFIEESIRE